MVMVMPMRMGVVVLRVDGNHRATLYYNITSVHRRPAFRAAPQVRQRTRASAAKSPAIEKLTDPRT